MREGPLRDEKLWRGSAGGLNLSQWLVQGG